MTQAAMNPDTLCPTPNFTLSDPSQKVLFARFLAKFWSLNQVEADTFFTLKIFVTMHKIGPRIFYFFIGVAIQI